MKFSIEVTETCKAYYIVEAENKESANELFEKWADIHQEWISDDLMDNCFGWEFSEPEPVKMDCEPDITYQTLEE